MANMEKESEFFRSPSCCALNLKWVVFLSTFLAAAQLQAQTPGFDETWTTPRTGSWFMAQNWTPVSVPTSVQRVLVNSGGTAQVGATGAAAGNLTIGISTPGSTVQLLPGGTLTVTQTVLVGAEGTLLSTGGTISASAFENSGVITSTIGDAISFAAGGSVINNATGTITGANVGIFTSNQVVNVTNFGKMTGTNAAIAINGGGTFANEAGASVTATSFEPVEIRSAGTVMIVNSGTISSNYGGIGFDEGGGTIVNNAGGVIQGTGANVQGPGVNSFGIAASSTTIPVAVINSGTISGVGFGYAANIGGSITNNMGGIIQGTGPGSSGIGFGATNGLVNILNSGTISGSTGIGVGAGSSVSVTNNATGIIVATTGNGVGSSGSSLTVVNSGTISSEIVNAISFGTGTTGSVTNNPGGVLASGGTAHSAVFGGGQISVSNAGTISGVDTGINLAAGGSITNIGFITGQGGAAVTTTVGGTSTIVNSGTISSVNASAINFQTNTSGSVTNNAGGILTGAVGHSGILAGSGNITVSNLGTINGPITLGSGSNTVTLFTVGKINGALNLGSNAASSLILDGSGQQSINEAVTGTITNLGSLTKQGASTWTLDEALNAPVSTKVLAGVLMVNSTLNTPVLNVEAGGTLAGSGIVTGKVINAGSLSPGNSPGIFTVKGDYTQSATGTLRIEVAGLAPSEHDLLAVTGHASLAGTLQLLGLGGFTLHVGDQLTLLTANGGVNGFFGTVQNELNTGTVVKAQVVTLSNAVVLEGTQGSFVQAACNANSEAVAQALDSAVGNPRSATLITFLNGQPLNSLCGDFTLIAPEALASIFNAGVSFANVQTANLMRRLEDVRAGDNGFNSSGFSLNGGASNFSTGLAGVTGPEGKSGPSVMTPTPENRWGVWVTGIGEFANVEGSDGAAGYDIQTGGVTFGVDYRACSIFAVGLTAGYANMNGDLPNGGSLDVNSGQFGIYATLFGSGFYADAAFTGGPSGYDTHRTALLGSANGNTDGGNFNALIAVGYDWKKGDLSIGPTANFQYSYVGVGGFTESGSIAPLNIDNQNVESERTAVGMKASYEWKLGHVIIKPEISAAWQHEFGDQSYSIVASFANGAGNSFTVSSPPIGRDSLLIGAGTAVLLNDRISIYAYYDGELLRTNYQSNSVSAGVRMTF
jgi:outer membrane autotransporter protein